MLVFRKLWHAVTGGTHYLQIDPIDSEEGPVTLEPAISPTHQSPGLEAARAAPAPDPLANTDIPLVTITEQKAPEPEPVEAPPRSLSDEIQTLFETKDTEPPLSYIHTHDRPWRTSTEKLWEPQPFSKWADDPERKQTMDSCVNKWIEANRRFFNSAFISFDESRTLVEFFKSCPNERTMKVLLESYIENFEQLSPFSLLIKKVLSAADPSQVENLFSVMVKYLKFDNSALRLQVILAFIPFHYSTRPTADDAGAWYANAGNLEALLADQTSIVAKLKLARQCEILLSGAAKRPLLHAVIVVILQVVKSDCALVLADNFPEKWLTPRVITLLLTLTHQKPLLVSMFMSTVQADKKRNLQDCCEDYLFHIVSVFAEYFNETEICQAILHSLLTDSKESFREGAGKAELAFMVKIAKVMPEEFVQRADNQFLEYCRSLYRKSNRISQPNVTADSKEENEVRSPEVLCLALAAVMQQLLIGDSQSWSKAPFQEKLSMLTSNHKHLIFDQLCYVAQYSPNSLEIWYCLRAIYSPTGILGFGKQGNKTNVFGDDTAYKMADAQYQQIVTKLGQSPVSKAYLPPGKQLNAIQP